MQNAVSMPVNAQKSVSAFGRRSYDTLPYGSKRWWRESAVGEVAEVGEASGEMLVVVDPELLSWSFIWSST